MATDYGTALRTHPDLTASSEMVKGERVVAEALYRRLTTPQGTLPFHPDYGRDLRRFLNGQVTDDALLAFKLTAERECLKDRRVLDATCTLEFEPATFSLRAKFLIELSDGPFTFLLLVTKLDTTFILEG